MDILSSLSSLSDLSSVTGAGLSVATAETSSSRRNGLVAEAASSLLTAAGSAYLKKTLKDEKEKLAASQTPIIDAALVIHTALSFCNGFGGPNSGGNLGTAAKDLDLAEQHLVQAGQTTGWTGTGENAYSGANDAQKTRANNLATIDRDFEKALKKQATEVLDLRENFGIIKTTMNVVKIVATALNLGGPTTAAYSIALQTLTAAECLSADAGLQLGQHSAARRNATEFAALAGRYQAV